MGPPLVPTRTQISTRKKGRKQTDCMRATALHVYHSFPFGITASEAPTKQPPHNNGPPPFSILATKTQLS
jgi:hypothetical protein